MLPAALVLGVNGTDPPPAVPCNQRTGTMKAPRRALLRLAGPAVAAALLASLAPAALARTAPPGGTPAAPGVAAQQAPAELTEAIRGWVEEQGRQYVGDCRSPQAQDSANVGSMCSTVVSLQDGRAEVAIGLVLSDAITTVTFQQVGNRWALPGETADDGATGGNAPEPGSPGEAGDRGLDLSLPDAAPWLLAAAAAAALLAVTAGGLALARRAG